MELWNNNIEIEFFHEAMKNFASPEQLFYKLKAGYFAYIPRGVDTENKTLQSRNSLIGQFTEKWCKTFFEPIANDLNLFAVNGVICDELGLNIRSSADLAFCTTNERLQKAENIKLLFEIKMSIVSNYTYSNTGEVKFIGDYKTHIGQPSLLRSDSMLKAIGKAINIRVSDILASKIPIIILGNSPITESYKKKVDFLNTSGVIQAFISLNPSPSATDFIECSPKKGFNTIKKFQEIKSLCSEQINSELDFFSTMISKSKLGEIISIASKEKTDIEKAEKFLRLIRS